MFVVLVLLVLGAVVGMCCIALAIIVHEARAQRAMQLVRRATVRTMAIGDVEIAGHVRTLRETNSGPRCCPMNVARCDGVNRMPG